MTTYTVNTTISPTSANTSTKINISKFTQKLVAFFSPNNRKVKEILSTTGRPVIFSSKINADPTIFNTKTDTNPVIFWPIWSLISRHYFLKIIVVKIIAQTTVNLISTYVFGKNMLQNLTTLISSKSSAKITIAKTSTTTGTSMDTEYDEDSEDTTTTPVSAISSSIITIDKTSTLTNTSLTTEYDTLIS